MSKKNLVATIAVFGSLVVGVSALPAWAAGPAKGPGRPAKADPKSTVPASGKTYELAVKDAPVTLTIDRAYTAGDVIRVTGPKHMVVRLDAALPEAPVYTPTGVIEYTVPVGRGSDREAMPREAFAGAKHVVKARAATAKEIATSRNVALNPYCMRGKHTNPIYPIATASSEFRNAARWSARNVIDGMTKTQKGRHGGWPFQSWGPDRRKDLWMKIDFGRPVEIDQLELHIRADFPHDRHWHGATMAFSDGSSETVAIKKVAGPQRFAFKKRTVTWVRMTKIIQAEPLGWCAWVELKFRGKDAAKQAASFLK